MEATNQINLGWVAKKTELRESMNESMFAIVDVFVHSEETTIEELKTAVTPLLLVNLAMKEEQ